MPHLQIWSIFLSQSFVFLSLQKAFSMFLKCVAFGNLQHNKPRSWVRKYLIFSWKLNRSSDYFPWLLREGEGARRELGPGPPFYILYTPFHTFYYRILSYYPFRATFPLVHIFSHTFTFLSLSFCCCHAFFFDDFYYFLLYILFYSLDSPAKVPNSSRVFLSKFFKLLFFGANHIIIKLSVNIIATVRNFVFFCLASMLLVQM